MQKSIEVSGKTEDAAIELALEQLGVTRDDVSVEIVTRAKAGFLGLKNSPAVIRVTYDFEESKVEREESKVERVEHFIHGLISRMGLSATLELSQSNGIINVTLTGDDCGALIGRRGETLDAIQHLANYALNKSGGGGSSRTRVSVDAENYRERRNESLEKLAVKIAEKALKYKRDMSLEPMNSYERHIVHTALQDYAGVSTHSVGTEPNRRVIVSYDKNAPGAAGDKPAQNFREWR